MIGAIAGDIIGSRFEKSGFKSTDFELFHEDGRFTDDTILTIAVADALLTDKDYAKAIRQYAQQYPNRGYGGTFVKWVKDESAGPYNSWGNGSAMRVSPIAYAFDSLEAVLREAEASAEVTHNHPEGIKGAQAVAAAIFMARQKCPKEEIRTYINDAFGYKLNYSVVHIRPFYQFDVSCQGSVPEAIIAFLDSNSTEEAIRLAVSLGGDADTQANIAGAIAEAYYKDLSAEFIAQVYQRIPAPFIKVLDRFWKHYS
ncbi:MAG: ADP-ribosylglycohydrolase family protein [Saprospiraceae bacterium]|nr:ADP-ribosylglycohydrolase family protein [Saprospiraceae bacterium]